MKAGFVQIFDTKDDAIEALGYAQTALPNHRHELVQNCHQIQVRAKIKDGDDNKAYGAPDAALVYLVLSIPN